MMNSKTHIAFGLTLNCALAYFSNTNILMLAPFAIIGSVMPDIDTEKSWAAQTVPFVDDFLRFISRKTNGFFKHRNIFTHGPIAIIILLYLIYKYSFNYFLIAFSIGYISHIILDNITKKRINTGTKNEDFFYNLIWIFNFIILFLIYKI
jgi:inner membrane protein